MEVFLLFRGNHISLEAAEAIGSSLDYELVAPFETLEFAQHYAETFIAETILEWDAYGTENWYAQTYRTLLSEKSPISVRIYRSPVYGKRETH